VTCSLLWVRCLFDRFSISDFGGKWPLKWKFSKMSFRIPRRESEIRFVTKFSGIRPLRSSRKVVWFTTQKTCAPRNSSQPPFCPKWADRAQNYLNVITAWPVHLYRIWTGSTMFCRTYSGKIDFFGPKSHYNHAFQPTMNVCNASWYHEATSVTLVRHVKFSSNVFCVTRSSDRDCRHSIHPCRGRQSCRKINEHKFNTHLLYLLMI